MSDNFSSNLIYILLIIFLVRGYFVFKKERNLQLTRNEKITKVIPVNSDVMFAIILSITLLFAVNYFINFLLY